MEHRAVNYGRSPKKLRRDWSLPALFAVAMAIAGPLFVAQCARPNALRDSAFAAPSSTASIRVPAAESQPEKVVWSYEVDAAQRPNELAVVARFEAGASDNLTIDEPGAPFVRDVEVWSVDGYRAAPRDGLRWQVACKLAGCNVKYRFALGEAAAALDNADSALGAGGLVVAPPSTWLLRPSPAPNAGRFRFHVRPPLGSRFEAGTLPAKDGAEETFEADVVDLEDASFAVFGPFAMERVRIGDALFEIAAAPSGLRLGLADVTAWIRSAASSVASYYGRFPAPRTLVIVVPGKRGEAEGVTLGNGGPAVLLRAGPSLDAKHAHDDWVATHELLHVTLPSLSREHAWLSEGLATYVEPVVRARAGLVSPEKYWGDLVAGLPQGMPEAGDEGLERTHTWGRTYWGGALFCLVSDLRIREETHGTRSLDDALRAIVATGADVETFWDILHFLEVGDRGTGTRALEAVYREMAFAPRMVDLASIWSDLGVRVRDGVVSFDDRARLAPVRKAITGRAANNR